MINEADFSNFLETLIACMPGNVYWADKNSVYLGCNDNVAHMLGLKTRKDIAGMTYADIAKIGGWDKDTILTFKKDDEDVISSGKPKLNIEEPPFTDKDGNVIHFLTSRLPLRNKDNEVIGIVGISIDITERKKAEFALQQAKNESLNILSGLSQQVMGASLTKEFKTPEEHALAVFHHLDSIIGCMPGNVYWADRNSVYYGCNDNVANMLGLKSRRDIVGITYEAAAKLCGWDKEKYESFKRDDEAVINSGKPRLNVEEPPITDAQGNLLYFLTNRVPIYDENNHVVGIVGISIDITERKKIEHELVKAKEAAEIANQTKTVFMENMSHDFKTPLNGIFGVVQLLKDRDDLPEDVKELVDAQYKSILRLNKLVQSVLDFDRISSGKIIIHEEEVNLYDILESIVHNLSYQIKDKNMKLLMHYSSTVPHKLISDSYAITSILLNLLSNAVKFTDEGVVSVTVNELSQEEHKMLVQISVTDTGSGIPEDKLDQIFERFHRLEPSNKGLKEGHGIGLSVVKELTEKLNGKIVVTSLIGKGSTFTVTLPFKLLDGA